MEYQKLKFERLLFEVTRKCNLKCAHCMRGNAQDISMSTDIIDRVIPQISVAMHIDLTGGEPMVVPEVIEYLVNSIIEHNVFITSISMVCNGTIMDDRAIRSIKAFNKLADYIYNTVIKSAHKEELPPYEEYKKIYPGTHIALITVSVDDYHDNKPDQARDYYRAYVNKYTEVYTDTEFRQLNEEKRSEKMQIRNIGNAKENNIGYLEVSYKSNKALLKYNNVCNMCHRIESQDNFVQCPISISAIGNICMASECSFENEDQFNMGNVFDISISDALGKWQWKEPLLCKEIDLLFKMQTYIMHENDVNEEMHRDAIEAIMLKRDSLKRIHDILPYLSYEDVVKASNADLNLKTKGLYNKIMSIVFPEDYDINYIYDEKQEEQTCTQMKIKNMLAMIQHL